MADFSAVLADMTDTLVNDSTVLAATIFGSLESGEMWEHSDLDMFAVLAGDKQLHSAAYLEKDGVMVHLQYLSKATLEELMTRVQGPFHIAFGSGRMLFCRDRDIQEMFTRCQQPTKQDVSLRLVEHLGKLLSAVYDLQKKLALDTSSPSFPQVTTLLTNWAALESIFNGEFLQRDPLSSLSHGSDEFLRARQLVLTSQGEPGVILHLVRTFLDSNIERVSEAVLEFASQETQPITYATLEESPQFAGLRTDFQKILEELAAYGLLVKRNIPFTFADSDQPIGEHYAYTVAE